MTLDASRKSKYPRFLSQVNIWISTIGSFSEHAYKVQLITEYRFIIIAALWYQKAKQKD